MHTSLRLSFGLLLVAPSGVAWADDAPAAAAAPNAVAPADPADPADPAAPAGVAVQSGGDWNALCLRRAVARWEQGDVAGAVSILDQRDALGTADPRADFLLAFGKRELGDRAGFLAATEALNETAPEAGPWAALARTLARLEAVAHEADAPAFLADDPGRSRTDRILALELLIRDGRARAAVALLEEGTGLPDAVVDALGVRARESANADPGVDLRRLAKRSPDTAVERDLVAAARLRMAGELLRAGRDPKELLDVEGDGRFVAAARHARALAALERNDVETARAELTALLSDEPNYERRREVAVALGFLRAQEEAWEDARLALRQAEAAWQGEEDALRALTADDAALDAAWSAWDAAPDATLQLDTDDTNASLRRVAAEARDLAGTPEAKIADATFRRPEASSLPASLTRPTDAERLAVAATEDSLRIATRALSEGRRALSAAEVDATRHGHYYERGRGYAADEGRQLRDSLARIDDLTARSDELLRLMAEVRDEEMRRILVRTAQFLRDAADNLVLAQSIQRFRIEGPAATRPERIPEGIPTPAELLAEEQLLDGDLVSWFETFAAVAPTLVERSHDEVWVPRVTEDLFDLQLAARHQGDWIGEIELAAASARDAATDPQRFAAARAANAATERAMLAYRDRARTQRREVVRTHVDAARSRLAAAHEGLSYGLAVATHEFAVSRPESEAALTSTLLAETAGRYEDFLARHDASPARSEVLFRLADLRLTVARDEFREQMAAFLGEGGDVGADGARAFAPFVEYGPALELYVELLEEHPQFAHRDAVLYHVGMILFDDADPAALGHLEELVSKFPASNYAQEAHLRLGDDRFDAKDFAGALPYYEAAAGGGEPEHAAIALYKAGWSHFNQDAFDASARSFRRLLDLYEKHKDAARTTDLRDEGERHLVEALARAGGASAFATLFVEQGGRPYEERVLDGLGALLRRFSLFDEAAATDSLWLARWPESPTSLSAAQRWVQMIERAEDADRARDRWLALAPKFRRDAAWWRANEGDSLRAEADEFARGAYVAAAVHEHRKARDTQERADWRRAKGLYEEVLAGWPEHGGAPSHHYYAGEAAAALEEYESALRHFATAAESDTASFRTDAAFQGIAVRDTWYEAERATMPAALAARATTPTTAATGAADSAASTAGPDSLARPLIESIDAFVAAWPADERGADLLWRKANVARTHEWHEVAAAGFGALLRTYPADERALPASQLRAQTFYDLEDFPAAAGAYVDARRLALAAGQDSLAAELAPLVPHCHFKEAERLAAADPNDAGTWAPKFEEVAERWPEWEHAEDALYRAGLGFAAAGQAPDAVRAWTTLGQRWPEGEYARDAALNIAQAWQKEDRPAAAARAFERFSERFAEDDDASAALLDAADLYAKAGDETEAERLRTRYLERFPEDVDMGFEILGTRAEKALEAVGPDRPLSTLLAGATVGTAAGEKVGAGAAGSAGAAPFSATGADAVARYLTLADANPELADRSLLARVQFLRGEEAFDSYRRKRISQPLEPSIAQKKSLLENVLQEYRTCAELGVAPWNRAAATRVGECLVGFGDALMESERPADLNGDDLLAYEEVLEEQSWEFFDRGEEAWAELIRQASESDDEWVARAKQLLWPRVAQRFVHRPEVEYPLIASRVDRPEAAE